MFEIVFSFNVKDNNIFPCFCQSEWACLHKTVNMVVFFVKSNENTYPTGRALMQMYIVVSIMKRENNNAKYLRLSNFHKLSGYWLTYVNLILLIVLVP